MHPRIHHRAPRALALLVAGLAGWRWWARARGVQLTLLVGSLVSLAVSLLTTNNFGGVAVGFRHATYLAPAMVVLLLPVVAGTRPAARLASLAVASGCGKTVTAPVATTTVEQFSSRLQEKGSAWRSISSSRPSRSISRWAISSGTRVRNIS